MFYAMRALAIDNDLAETHALLAMYAGAEGARDRPGPLFDWAETKREIDRARELDAASPLVRLRYAMMWLLIECRLKDAAAEIELALDSDPQSTFLRAWLACMLWLDRQYDRAAEQARLIVELDPTSPHGPWLLGMVIRDQGRFDESIAAHRAAVHLSGGSPLMLGWLGLALGQGGHAADARALLEQLHAMANARYVPPTAFAWTHYGLGELDQAFLWMDRAADGRDRMMVPLQSYPFLDPIRTDPRYVALLKKMNFRTEGVGACLPPEPLRPGVTHVR
jgi:tetratricopeptide (TPR) repeat protein